MSAICFSPGILFRFGTAGANKRVAGFQPFCGVGAVGVCHFPLELFAESMAFASIRFYCAPEMADSDDLTGFIRVPSFLWEVVGGNLLVGLLGKGWKRVGRCSMKTSCNLGPVLGFYT